MKYSMASGRNVFANTEGTETRENTEQNLQLTAMKKHLAKR